MSNMNEKNDDKLSLVDVHAGLSFHYRDNPDELAMVLSRKIGIDVEKTTDILGISPENPRFDLSSRDVAAAMISYLVHERGKTDKDIYIVADELFIETVGLSLEQYIHQHPKYRDVQKTDEMKHGGVKMIRLPDEWATLRPPAKDDNPGPK